MKLKEPNDNWSNLKNVNKNKQRVFSRENHPFDRKGKPETLLQSI